MDLWTLEARIWILTESIGPQSYLIVSVVIVIVVVVIVVVVDTRNLL